MHMGCSSLIAAMVKARECCRRLVQAYEQVRVAPDVFTNGPVGFLRTTDATAQCFLHYLRMLPRDIGSFVSGQENRLYALRLRAEIRELLERAMILERETRQLLPTGTDTSATSRNPLGFDLGRGRP